MTDREDQLAGLRAQIGGIDPQLDAAQGYVGAVQEMRKTVRQQGEVMQATLANNHTLYHTNKRLVPENRQLRGRIAELEKVIQNKDLQIAELQEGLRAFPVGGNLYKSLYERATKTLAAYLYDLLDTDQLKERLEQMKAQAAEIEALPEAATPIEIARGEYSDPYHPEAQAQALRERRENEEHRS